MLGKIMAGIMAVAVASTSAWGSSVLFQMEPSAKTLEQKPPSTAITTDKLGGVEANKKFLVANDEENQNWWNWAFDNLFKKTEDAKRNTLFQSVKRGWKAAASGGTVDTSDKGLNEACDEAYKKSLTEFTSQPEPTLKSNVEAFCSLDRSQVLTTTSSS